MAVSTRSAWYLFAVLLAAALAAGCSSAPPPAQPPTRREVAPARPLVRPLPDPTPSGWGLTISEFATLPRSEPNPPVETGDNNDRWNRINYLGEIPDGSGRLYVPDLNGKLYLLKDGVPSVYLDVGGQVGPNFWDHDGIGAGFGFVAFHPDFQHNGKFYTIHTEGRDALRTAAPDLPSPPNADSHGVITEWTASNPSADTFQGTHREVLRIGFQESIHGVQQIGFNPTAKPGDADYGLLYLAVGDGGAAGDAEESKKTLDPQDMGLPQGKILRIDPLGNNGAHGRYGIPPSNPFVGKAGVLPEIYASGLRGPYRFSWAPVDHRMFLGNIGNEEVESIYEVRAGDNFGWSGREGPFVVRLGEGPDSCDIYALPADDHKNGYTYPVAAYGHNIRPPGWPKCEDSGYAVIAGPVYRGNALPDLRGTFVFGDGVTGRVFFTSVAEMRRETGKLAPIHELALLDQAGHQVTLDKLAGNPDVELAGHLKVDLRFGTDGQGELYLLSKANGKIWKVTGMRKV